jgi:tetratricopeptide (TPR) repeat protein
MRTSASPFSNFFRLLLPALLLFAGPALARADDQDQPEKPKAELSEPVAEKLQGLAPLEAAKQWDQAISLVDSLLATVSPNSFDNAELSMIKANYLVKKNRPLDALEPLETALRLSDTYGFFAARAQDLRFYLANLYYDRGGTVNKKNVEAQTADYQKARTYIEKWLQITEQDHSGAPMSSDALSKLSNAKVVYASLLFTMADVDPKHPNIPLVRKALAEVDAGLSTTARPPDNFYVIKLAALQRLSDYAGAADILEHVLKTKTDNKTYWQQLVAFYMTLAGEAEKNRASQQARDYNIRAIVSIERAQQHGALLAPEDNFTLVGLYFNVGQYSQAAELLENGLHHGAIKSTESNWILLANTYQELHKDMKAVEVLREASGIFPTSGQFDYLAAQILYGLNKTSDALAAIQSSVAKNGGNQQGQRWLFLSYLAYELQNYELTKSAAENALKYPNVDVHQADSLRDAANSALERREAELHT